MRSFPTLSLLPMLLACGGLSALNAQTVSTDQTKLTFFSQVGGSVLSQTLNVTSTGGATTFAVFVTSGTWLKVNNNPTATNGTTPSAVTVTADPTGLASGVYNGTLTVSGGVSAVAPVAVALTVSPIGINPQSATFSYTMGGTVPVSQSIALAGPITTYTATTTTQSGGNWFGLVANNILVNTLNGQSPGALILALNSTILPGLAAGTYNGAVTITPTSGGTTTPVTVAVVLTVTPTPPVSANPSSLIFNVQIGGTNNILTQTVVIGSTPGVPLNFALGSSVNPNPAGKNWIVLGTSSGVTAAGTGTAAVNIGVDTTNLPVGTYTGKVTVVSQGSPASLDVPITLLISNSPLLNVPTSALNFTYQLGGSTPASQTVTVTATSGTLQFTIADPNNRPWLTMPATGTTPTPFTVAINPAGLTGLTPGTYSTTLNITGIGAGNGVQQIPVNLIVTNNPNIVSSVSALSFPFQIGKATPAPVTVNLTSSTGATLNYTATAATATCGNAWLLLNGTANGTASGTTAAGSFLVGINTAALAAGNCTGTISVAATNLDGTAVGNSPISIAVTLVVSNTPLLVANPATQLTFTTQLGQSPATQQISLATTSATDQVSFSAAFATSSGGNWLPVGQTITGSTPSNILVPVSSALLSAGTYSGTVTITASGPGGATVANSPLVIAVTLTVTSGSLTVAPTTLTFSQTLGGSAPAAQTVTLGSSGQPLTYTATPSSSGNWLSVTPASGTTTSNPTLSVTVDGSKLAAGTYAGIITVVSPGAANSPATITVTLTVTPGTISAPTATLTFNQAAGGAAPAAQTFNVTSTPGPVAFTVAASTKSGGNWLTATPASGNTPGTVSVSVSAGSLAPGVYTGAVTITSAATGSPISVPVTFNVLAAQTLVATPASLNFSYTLLLPAPSGQSLQVSAVTAGTPFTVTAQVASGPAGWLVVTPASGNTPAPLAVSFVTTGLTVGTFNGTITIASPSAITPTVVPVTLTVVAVPIPVITAITNAASGSTGGVAPGEIVSIFGTGIGPATPAFLQVANGTVTSLIGNTRVLFDGVAAPVTFASATQTNVIVPYGVAGRTSTNVQVEFFGVQSAATSFNVVATSPGIFSLNLSGTGPGATLNQDGVTVNGPATPAPKGSVVSVFMTGEGQTTPIGTNGTVTPTDGSGLKKPILAVTATIGGVSVPATVLYAGSAPGLVSGAMQVNVQIPAGAPSGTAVPLAITVGSTSTQAGITIAVQ